MKVIRIVLCVCKQTRIGCDCYNLFCVLCRSSAVPWFFRVKPIWFFSTKKKRRKLANKVKVKCGRRAQPNGLASCVKHHLVKGRRGIDFANKGFNTFSYHKKETIEVQRLQSRLKKKEMKKQHKRKKKLIFGLYQIRSLVKQRAPCQTLLTRGRNSFEQKKTT